MALQAPIDRFTHRTLRAAALELKEGERRQNFAQTMYVGVPGSCASHVEDPRRRLDPGLRADLVLAMIQWASTSTPRVCAWLTRPGELHLHDDDVAWASAVRWAASASDRDVGLVVVTRHGWFDPESGVRREWRRLRRRTAAGGAAQSQV